MLSLNLFVTRPVWPSFTHFSKFPPLSSKFPSHRHTSEWHMLDCAGATGAGYSAGQKRNTNRPSGARIRRTNSHTLTMAVTEAAIRIEAEDTKRRETVGEKQTQVRYTCIHIQTRTHTKTHTRTHINAYTRPHGPRGQFRKSK